MLSEEEVLTRITKLADRIKELKAEIAEKNKLLNDQNEIWLTKQDSWEEELKKLNERLDHDSEVFLQHNEMFGQQAIEMQELQKKYDGVMQVIHHVVEDTIEGKYKPEIKKFQELLADYKTLGERVQELEADKGKALDENKALQQKFDEKIKELKSLEKENGKLKKSNEGYEKLITSKDSQIEEYNKKVESLQKGAEKAKEKASKEIDELKATIKGYTETPEIKTANAEQFTTYPYRIGRTSEKVMKRFVKLALGLYADKNQTTPPYSLKSFEEAGKEEMINAADVQIIKTHLMSMKSPTGENLIIERDGSLFTVLSPDEMGIWISSLDENKK